MNESSNLYKVWNAYKEPLACLFCLGMIIGFFYSRAALSISIVLLFANALFPPDFEKNWKAWKKDKFSIACFLFFAAYLVSGLWSEDYTEWWNIITNKLPFLVLPFAFLSIPFTQKKYRNFIILTLLLLQVIVILYSLSQLFLHPEFYIKGYNFSHVLPTTKYNDHIRFSLSLVLSLLIIFYFLFENGKTSFNRSLILFFTFCGVLFIVYLHILATKTGLLCLYLMALLYVFVKLYKNHKILVVIIILSILAIPVIAYFTIPTFQKKIDYVHYEYKIAKNQEGYNYRYSDQGRMLSYKIGLSLLKSNLLLGTGAGDLKMNMDRAYRKNHPEVPPENHLIPHNQFLFSALALGILLFSTLLFMCFYSFFQLGNPRLYGQITAVIMITAFLAEAMLEVQFGIFVYLFFTLFWRNIISSEYLKIKT